MRDNIIKVACGILLGLGVGIWWMSHFNWWWLLYYLHLTAGLAFFGAMLHAIKNAASGEGDAYRKGVASAAAIVASAAAKVIRPTTPFENARKFVATLFRSLYLFLSGFSFPISMVVQGIFRPTATPKSALELSALATLNRSETAVAAALLILNCLILIYQYYFGSTNYVIHVLLWTTLASIISGFFAYLTSTVGLAEELRKAPGSALWKYVQVLLLHLVSLILIFIGLTGVPMELSTFAHAIADNAQALLFNFSLLWDIILFKREFDFVAFQAVCGLLYWISLGATLKQLDKLKRTDADMKAIVTSYVFLRKYDKALEWLNKIAMRDNTYYIMEATCYLGRGQVDRAWKTASRGVPRENDLSAANVTATVLVDAFLMFGIPENVKMTFISKCIESGITDGALTAFVLAIVPEGDMGSSKKLQNEIGKLIKRDIYPLAATNIMIKARKFDEAQAVLPTGPLASPDEEITRIATDVNVKHNIAEDDAKKPIFESCAERNLSTATTCAGQLKSDLQKVRACWSIWQIEAIAYSLGSGVSSMFRQVRESIVLGIEDDRVRQMTQEVQKTLGAHIH